MKSIYVNRDDVLRHVAQTTASTMSPQDRFRQNGSGEILVSGTLFVKKPVDTFFAVASIVMIFAVTMNLWAPTLEAFLRK